MKATIQSPVPSATQNEIVEGLSHEPKHLPTRLLYDEQGSKLFEQIGETSEYYLTRTELELLKLYGPELASLIDGNSLIVEFGAGNMKKAEVLLAQLMRPVTYVPVDISEKYLNAHIDRLMRKLPHVHIEPIVGDFTRLNPSQLFFPDVKRTVLFVPGSAIGNFEPIEAIELLKTSQRLVGENGAVLIGVDLKKSPAIIHAAYNDKRGVTAAFEKNIVHHVNRELGTHLNPIDFEYDGFYNEPAGRVEMYLKSRRHQTFRAQDRILHLRPNERIHIENSYKYSLEDFQALAQEAGFRTAHTWVDKQKLFSIHFLVPDLGPLDEKV